MSANPTHRRRRLLALMAPAALLLFTLALTACTSPAGAAPIRLAGFLEAATVDVEPEQGGRIIELTAEEGDKVEAGQVLVRLDDSRLRLQLAQADAAVEQAEARLALLKASVRPEDVARAEAAVAYAQAGLAAAESALADAELLRDTPQQSDLEITQAQAALAEAQARATAALRAAEAADGEVQLWGAVLKDLEKGFEVDVPGVFSGHFDAPREKLDYTNEQWNLASQKAWAAWQSSAAADAAALQAEAALNDRRRERSFPLEAEDRVVAATNARDQAAAQLEQARSSLAAVRAGPTAKQIAAAEAAVAQAQSNRAAIAARLDQSVLAAPRAGTVTARYRAQGEVAGPNQRIFTISDPSTLEITVYAPVGLLARLQPGMELPLTVDSAPGESFLARVVTLSSKPEFSLRQAENVAERANAVYAVKLQVASPGALLRPGMPADVLLP